MIWAFAIPALFISGAVFGYLFAMASIAASFAKGFRR